jgi:Fur family ferric uptake transcriptional regulator
MRALKHRLSLIANTFALRSSFADNYLNVQRTTKQQGAVFEVIREAGRPLSPGEVLKLASKTVSSLNLATVYRNVNAMVSDKVIVQVDVLGQAPRYEVANLPHHHHFLCDKCDRLYDVEGCPGGISHLVPPGFKLTTHELVMKGNCRNCRT